ncbi:MAG TPA: hypothetical protein VGF94_28035 [Kofleriaceae bacterium]|jgi:hypothetical protein
MSDDDDPELAELVRANRRAAGGRMLVVGLLVALGGVGVLVYGMSLANQQAGSAVQFTLPDKLTLVGGIAAAIGVLLAIPGVIQLVRAR